MFQPDKYLSVSWQKGGRAFPHVDCFGLVNEIRRDMSLAPWPDFFGVTKDNDGLNREAKSFIQSLVKCEPEPGAGVVCFTGKAVTHVAVVVTLDGVLHVAECNPGQNVTFLPVERFIRKFVRVEFWK